MGRLQRLLICLFACCILGCATQNSLPVTLGTEADEQAIRAETVQQITSIEPDSKLDEHLLKNLKCDVGKTVHIHGSEATLMVEVTNTDLKKAFDNACVELSNAEQLDSLADFYMNYEDTELESGIVDAICRNVDSLEDKTTTSVELHFTKQDNQWKLDEKSSVEFAKAVYSGLKD